MSGILSLQTEFTALHNDPTEIRIGPVKGRLCPIKEAWFCSALSPSASSGYLCMHIVEKPLVCDGNLMGGRYVR